MLDSPSKQRFQKFANAAQKLLAECTILLDENRLLFEQNNESNCRQSTRSTVVGKAKVMSYQDIVEAQAKRDAKDATVVKGKPGRKRKSSILVAAQANRLQKSKMEVAEEEIEALEYGDHCSVLHF
jgi:hypothetical protein